MNIISGDSFPHSPTGYPQELSDISDISTGLTNESGVAYGNHIG